MATKQFIIREAAPGEAGYVDYMHMKLYTAAYGFKPIFEHYVLKGMAEFLGDSQGGKMWVAQLGGEIVGSISIVKADDNMGQIRWFIVSGKHQGMGIGKALIETALQFCRQCGYKGVMLWTADVLPAALHIYLANGFKLTAQQPNNTWTDGVINEQKYELLF